MIRTAIMVTTATIANIKGNNLLFIRQAMAQDAAATPENTADSRAEATVFRIAPYSALDTPDALRVELAQVLADEPKAFRCLFAPFLERPRRPLQGLWCKCRGWLYGSPSS